MSIPNATHGYYRSRGSNDLECGWKTLDEDDCDMWPERKLNEGHWSKVYSESRRLKIIETCDKKKLKGRGYHSVWFMIFNHDGWGHLIRRKAKERCICPMNVVYITKIILSRNITSEKDILLILGCQDVGKIKAK